ncbi:SDR family NAD(P)-dependent oxidoreductase [Microbacterium paludicola]|uniref:SDR family NAD(P)-dependent oxidoreductase n=1 Tax=Microbacterium paludicola TaxID=300019 RepID=UPI00387A20F5
MEQDLGGKRAFVSGATQGIGFAIARQLAEASASVVVNGRGEERVRAACERLRTLVPGADIDGIAADFAAPEQVDGLLSELGEVDILVNNVGLFGVAPFADVPDEEWRRYFEVNVMSGVRLSRLVLPGMLDRGRGRILFVSSESGVNVPADMVHYGVSKAAMIALANGLAKLTRGTAVTVNTILGGPTYSDGVAEAVEGIARVQGLPPEQVKESIISANATTLLQRFIEPDEIAHLARYLASSLSSATNGATLRADGGVLTTLL